MAINCNVLYRGIIAYATATSAMEMFTDSREQATNDQIWVLQHPPVFTQGTSCRAQPEQNPRQIPVIHSNRGGQLTYHAPGQLIIYLLLDLKRLGLGVRRFVNLLELSVIQLLQQYGLTGRRLQGAPGVYVDGKKIAALGLRIRRGKCLHGLSLNIAMDMTPFDWIKPCGLVGIKVTQLASHGVKRAPEQCGEELNLILGKNLGLALKHC